MRWGCEGGWGGGCEELVQSENMVVTYENNVKLFFCWSIFSKFLDLHNQVFSMQPRYTTPALSGFTSQASIFGA